MAITYSPLRYPGGKSSLSPFLAQVVRLNGLEGVSYVEPYAGGAGAALTLLFKGVVDRIIINDYDPVIYAFWSAILNKTDEFIQRVTTIALNIDEWHRQKKILKFHEKYDSFDVGFAAFYMNRCNRSGILAAGPIGGQHQSGEYTLGVRFNREKLVKKIRKIAEHKNNIYIYNLDAIDLIKDVIPSIEGPKFIYLDPPYYEKGKQLYLNSYEHEDHENLAWAVSKIDSSDYWILTYDDVSAIRELYDSNITSTYSLNYSAHHARKGSELLIAPHRVLLPCQVDITYGLS